MNHSNDKVIFNVQYIIINVIAVASSFLPNYKLVIKVAGVNIEEFLRAAYGYEDLPTSYSTYSFFKLVKNPISYLWSNYVKNNDLSYKDWISECGYYDNSILPALALVLFVPLLLLLVSLILQILAMQKNRWLPICALFPGLAALIALFGYVGINAYIKNHLAKLNQVFPLFEEEGQGSISISPRIGLILLILLSLALAIENLVLMPRLNVGGSQLYRSRPGIPGSGGMGYQGMQPNMPGPQGGMAGRPNRLPAGAQGQVECIRGEYKGAKLPINPGDILLIGRDSTICQLVFSDMHVSRKHCSVTYSPQDGMYIITNYSKNGMQLSDGTDLPCGEPRRVPSGTAFRINEDNVFKTL